jgi:uncharacterized protein YjbI with pentapeptide repeats
MRQAINPMPLEDAEYQHTYLVPTQEITFNQAIESRLRFEGADLSGADFRNAQTNTKSIK